MTEELLSGGLVISGDPAFNKPGELSRAENAYYRHDDDGLHRYPGVSQDTVIAEGYAVNGITTCRFADKHWLVAQAASKYWIADAETDGAPFATALSVTEGQTLQAFTHSNRWFVLNGVDQNQVLKSDGTFRPMGMKEVKSSPAFTGFVTGKTFSATATGWYDYWYTEVYDDGAGTVLESASSGVLTIEVTTTATAPTFVLPTPLNANTTKVLMYRSTKKASATDLGYPVGYVIAELTYSGIPITFTDTGNALQTSSFARPSAIQSGTAFTVSATAAATHGLNLTATFSATAAHGSAGARAIALYEFSDFGIDPPSDWPSTNQYTVAYSACISASGGGTPDTFYGSLIPAVRIAASANTYWVSARGVLSEGGSSYGVHPITINSDGSISPADPYYVAIVPVEGVPFYPAAATAVVAATANLTTTERLYALSGDWTLLVVGYFPSDTVTSTTTQVRFTNPSIAANYYGGALASGDAYPTVTFTIDSAATIVSSNTPPPVSSCGCVFAGQSVCNDINNPRSARYALGDEPESWPSLYELILPIRDNDSITALFPIDNVLISGTKGSIWAIHYLPNEQDASIQRGIVSRQISDKHNVVGPDCVALYTNVHGTQEAAFVSTNGIYSTDGNTITDLGVDLVWSGLPDAITGPLNSSIYARCVALVNDAATQNLKFFYQAPNGDTQVFTANYGRRHMKPTELMGVYNPKWAGPSHVSKYTNNGTRTSVNCAWSYKRNTGLNVIVHGRGSAGSWAGSVAREDGEDTVLAHTMPDAQNNTIGFTTRDMYLAGKGRQFTINDAWLYGYRTAAGNLDTPVGTLTITQMYVNGDTIETPINIMKSPYVTKLISLPVGSVNADAVALTFKATYSDPYTVYSIIFDAGDGGDSKRA